jgi:DNA-binding NarL/FixJ family response regulator
MLGPVGAVRKAPARSGRTFAGPLTQPLTDRELNVVRLVALGRTNAEIAAELYLSLSSVKANLSRINLKLAKRDRVEIAAWAWENGQVQPGL